MDSAVSCHFDSLPDEVVMRIIGFTSHKPFKESEWTDRFNWEAMHPGLDHLVRVISNISERYAS